MTVTKTYGNWNNAADFGTLTVEHSVSVALGDYADAYDVDGIAADYRDAINAALPEGVSLCGDQFIGPYYEADKTWGPELERCGSLNIRKIVREVDFWAIAAKHDKTVETL